MDHTGSLRGSGRRSQSARNASSSAHRLRRGKNNSTITNPFDIKDMRESIPLHPIRDKFVAEHESLMATTFGKESRDMKEIPCYGKDFSVSQSELVTSRVAFQGGIGQPQLKFKNMCGGYGSDTYVNEANFNTKGAAAFTTNGGGSKNRTLNDRPSSSALAAPSPSSSPSSSPSANTITGHPYKVNRFAIYSDRARSATPLGNSATDHFIDSKGPNSIVAQVPDDLVDYTKILSPHRWERQQKQLEQHQRALFAAEQQKMRGTLSNVGFGAGSGRLWSAAGSSSPHHRSASVVESTVNENNNNNHANGSAAGNRSPSPTRSQSSSPRKSSASSNSNGFVFRGASPFQQFQETYAAQHPKRFGTVRDTAAAIEAEKCRSTRPKLYEQIYFGTGGTVHGLGTSSPSIPFADMSAHLSGKRSNSNVALPPAVPRASEADAEKRLSSSILASVTGKTNNKQAEGHDDDDNLLSRFRTMRVSSGRKLVGPNGRNDQTRSVLTGLLTSTFQGRGKGSGMGVGCVGNVGGGSMSGENENGDYADDGAYHSEDSADAEFFGRNKSNKNHNNSTSKSRRKRSGAAGGRSQSPGPAAYETPSLFDKAAQQKERSVLQSAGRKPVAALTRSGLCGVDTTEGASAIRSERVKEVERIKASYLGEEDQSGVGGGATALIYIGGGGGGGAPAPNSSTIPQQQTLLQQQRQQPFDRMALLSAVTADSGGALPRSVPPLMMSATKPPRPPSATPSIPQQRQSTFYCGGGEDGSVTPTSNSAILAASPTERDEGGSPKQPNGGEDDEKHEKQIHTAIADGAEKDSLKATHRHHPHRQPTANKRSYNSGNRAGSAPSASMMMSASFSTPASPVKTIGAIVSHNAQLREQHARRDRIVNATPDRLF